MTLAPTHLSLGSILLWVFLPTSEKERFQKRKWLFWLVVSFTVLPDIDVFFGLHRGITHSLIIPTIMTILGTLVYYNYQYLSCNSSNIQKKEEDLDKYSFIGRCILYAGITWLIHIILDLEYPIALFYPLSDRLYQFNFTILFDLMPWLIFPVTIIGIGFEITGISYLKGITTYFVNLSPSTRQEIFGSEPLAISINDFFIHVILFSIFLVYVARPMAPTIKITRLSEWRKKIHYDAPILGLGVVLIIIGVIFGPMMGLNTSDTDSTSSSFQVSSTVFSPAIAITFETTNYLFQPNTLFSIESTFKTSSYYDPFDQILLLTTQEQYNNFSSGVSQLFKQYPLNSSEDITTFQADYQDILFDLITYPLAMNLTNQNETSLNTQQSNGHFALVGVIESWDSTLILNGTHLSENVELSVTIISSRFTLFFIGIASIITGVVVSLVVSVRVKRGDIYNHSVVSTDD